MKTISLKVDDDIFRETEKIVGELKQARNRYINEALAHYNRTQRRKLIEKQLAYESAVAREESMKVLKEFEPFMDETLKDHPYEA